MKASSIKRKIKKISVGVIFTPEEIICVDHVAARLNPACPKRSESLRYLLALGYEVFCKNVQAQVVVPPPSLTPVTTSVEVANVTPNPETVKG